MGHGWAAIILLAMIVSACSEVDLSKVSDEDMERISDKLIVCNKPYIRFGASCCLDRNDNKVCDVDDNLDSNSSELPSVNQNTTPTSTSPVLITNPPTDNSTPLPEPSEDLEEVNGTATSLKEEELSLPRITGDAIIVNSRDWRDVYSGLQYANLHGLQSHFLTNEQHAPVLLYSIPTTQENITVLSNQEQPIVAGYSQTLRARGHSVAKELNGTNLNLELLKRAEARRFVIVDDTYGYDAISAAPYSIVDRSFVIFATRDNIGKISQVLSAKRPEKIMIFGDVDPEVAEALASYKPEILDNRGKFDNNLEMNRRYIQLHPTKQIILTNGDFIEASIMSGQDPVIFLGRENVPQAVRDFIREEDIEAGVLIGNELVNAATFVRRQLGISVFVKFADGVRQPSGAISTVEEFGRFPVSGHNCSLMIQTARIARTTGDLEVEYENTGQTDCALKSTITVRSGTEIKVTGDLTAVALPPGARQTVSYTADSNGAPLRITTDATADIFTVFGQDAGSLENIEQKSVSLEIA